MECFIAGIKWTATFGIMYISNLDFVSWSKPKKKEYIILPYRYSRDAKTENEVHHFQNVQIFQDSFEFKWGPKYRGCRTIKLKRLFQLTKPYSRNAKNEKTTDIISSNSWVKQSCLYFNYD